MAAQRQPPTTPLTAGTLRGTPETATWATLRLVEPGGGELAAHLAAVEDEDAIGDPEQLAAARTR